MSTVYKCFKRKNDKIFAVKVTRSDDTEILDQAENEFEIIKVFDHPNVIKGYEIFRNDLTNTSHTVMKYVEGTELIKQIC